MFDDDDLIVVSFQLAKAGGNCTVGSVRGQRAGARLARGDFSHVHSHHQYQQPRDTQHQRRRNPAHVFRADQGARTGAGHLRIVTGIHNQQLSRGLDALQGRARRNSRLVLAGLLPPAPSWEVVNQVFQRAGSEKTRLVFLTDHSPSTLSGVVDLRAPRVTSGSPSTWQNSQFSPTTRKTACFILTGYLRNRDNVGHRKSAQVSTHAPSCVRRARSQ